MVGLILKLIICPITLIISTYIFGLDYTLAQAIIVGIVLAIVAHMMEVMILKKGTFWSSTVGDFIAAFAIVYLSQYFLRDVSITFSGALLTAILLTITEYFQHNYLIRSGKTKKAEE